MASTIVELRNVSKSFSSKPLLEDFNLSIGDKKFVTLLGPSGCGKTTILRLIAGLESPDKGRIFLNGEDITNLPCNRRKINTVFQNYALFPHMNVFDNIAFGLRMSKTSDGDIKKRVGEILELIKMQNFLGRYPHELSGGQQQRVALARALVNRPLLLLLDESLSALDKNLRSQMQLELKAIQRNLGLTFLFVTHDQEEALSLSDQIVVMNHGIIEQVGTPKEVYELPKNLFVANFIGQSNFFEGVVNEIFSHQSMSVRLHTGEFKFAQNGLFRSGDKVKILLRAEDLKIYSQNDISKIDQDMPIFRGKVVERTYKGMTLDSQIKLENGQDILIQEFFDEDDPDFDYRLGEDVLISWKKNWEVILPYEDE